MRLLILLNLVLCVHSVEVNTSYGTVYGQLSTVSSGVETFFGIPYAKAPINTLRWKKPLPIDPWTTPLNASSFGPKCMQHSLFGMPVQETDMSEDCLSLNIYRPTGTPFGLPVMIWLHSGTFQEGSGQYFDGTWLAEKGTIVVTINYRLGIFGFGSSGKDSSGNSILHGNYGLLDQNEAISFVNQIVSDFGGDHRKITIFGNSAGGGSVMYHLLSPLSKGLVERGISQSGTPIMSSTPADDRLALNKVCRYFSGCDATTTTDKVVNKLMKASATDLMLALTNSPYEFVPSPFDGVFFPIDVRVVLASKDITCYDFIGGWNNRDGSLKIASGGFDIMDIEDFNSKVNPNYIDFGKGPLNNNQAQATFDEYASHAAGLRWSDFWTDAMFAIPLLTYADALATSGCENVYIYRLSHNVPVHGYLGYNFSPSSYGSSFMDELAYLFPTPATLGFSWNEVTEVKIRNVFQSFWFEFADGLPFVSGGWNNYAIPQRMILDIKFSFSEDERTIIDYSPRATWLEMRTLTNEPVPVECVDDPEGLLGKHHLICNHTIHDLHTPCYLSAQVYLPELTEDITLGNIRICPVTCGTCPKDDDTETSSSLDSRSIFALYFLSMLIVLNY